jgi:hypothetical protein
MAEFQSGRVCYAAIHWSRHRWSSAVHHRIEGWSRGCVSRGSSAVRSPGEQQLGRLATGCLTTVPSQAQSHLRRRSLNALNSRAEVSGPGSAYSLGLFHTSDALCGTVFLLVEESALGMISRISRSGCERDCWVRLEPRGKAREERVQSSRSAPIRGTTTERFAKLAQNTKEHSWTQCFFVYSEVAGGGTLGRTPAGNRTVPRVAESTLSRSAPFAARPALGRALGTLPDHSQCDSRCGALSPDKHPGSSSRLPVLLAPYQAGVFVFAPWYRWFGSAFGAKHSADLTALSEPRWRSALTDRHDGISMQDRRNSGF